MKKVEIVLVLLVLIMIPSYFLDYIPGSLLFLPFIILSCLYFYFGFILFTGVPLKKMFKKDSYKGISTGKILGAISAGIIVSIIVLGILFSIMNWPFSGENLLIGLIFLMVITTISLFKYLKQPNLYYKKILFRSITYSLVSVLFLYVLPSHFFVSLKYREYPEYVNTVKQLHKDPDNMELKQKEEELYNEIRYNKTGVRD